MSISPLVSDDSAFSNVALLDFSLASEREAFRSAIDTLRTKLEETPSVCAPKYGGNVARTKTGSSQKHVIENSLPENVNCIMSRTSCATQEDGEEALRTLLAFQHTWNKTPVEARAQVLERAAEIMLQRRYELAALITLEAAKPWSEADADVAEAIDFCRYYAIEARKLFVRTRHGQLQGELNFYFHEARGVTAVISPWNFPFAIPCGMFAAALVTGNCTILKPAEQTPVIAQALFDIFLEAGVPSEAVAFLPGLGEEIGSYLVKHPQIPTIVFTGSKEVGLSLVRSGADTKDTFLHVKRVIAEMGGKNAIVIDADADLDEALAGVLYSAFGFQGQKCSACSRVFVTSEPVFKAFCDRLAKAITDLRVGPSTDPGTIVGPVIDRDAFERIKGIIARARARCTLIGEGRVPDEIVGTGNYIAPVAFAPKSCDDEIMHEEIFGPVLAVTQVSSFEEGVKRAIDIPYRLTGGIFSRNPKNIEYAIEEFAVGNLYINRSCTGALVYRQPFGGAHMSGVGSKAGGPDYLLQFTIPRTVSENTVRQGFAPA